jgi:hypothetical protein
MVWDMEDMGFMCWKLGPYAGVERGRIFERRSLVRGDWVIGSAAL